MSELSHYEKTGYLHDDFKIFHLKIPLCARLTFITTIFIKF